MYNICPRCLGKMTLLKFKDRKVWVCVRCWLKAEQENNLPIIVWNQPLTPREIENLLKMR